MFISYHILLCPGSKDDFLFPPLVNDGVERDCYHGDKQEADDSHGDIDEVDTASEVVHELQEPHQHQYHDEKGYLALLQLTHKYSSRTLAPAVEEVVRHEQCQH